MKPAGSPIWMGDAAHALRQAAQALSEISETARLDAELLMAHALGIDRDKLLFGLADLDAPPLFQSLLERRLQSEPVAYILGAQEFWGLNFQVSPDVLIPRPDSELLIEEAIRVLADSRPQNILDVGTGSGALLLAALSEFAGAKGLGIDSSPAALQIAHNNADALKLSERTSFALLDWTMAGWSGDIEGVFDLVLANPPYVSTNAVLSRDVSDFEPHSALFAGEDGLADYLLIIPALENLLAKNGIALLEIGFDQATSVTALAQKNGYHVECKQDLGGNDRLLTLRR